jgi:hypothetical protein
MADLKEQADVPKPRGFSVPDSLDPAERGPSGILPPPTMTEAEVRAHLLAFLGPDLDPAAVPGDVRAELLEQARRRADHGGVPKTRKYDPVVYYMRVGNRIKIGFTGDLIRRTQAVGPEEVLATEPGSFAIEKRRHNEFGEYHVINEWFAQGPRLLEHIVKLRGGRA